MTGTIKEMEDYLRRVMDYAKDDSLERAESAFRRHTTAQMQELYGQSGQTCQQILDGYRESRRLHNNARLYLESLLTKA